MSDRAITIKAPSRLHFGMLSFGQPGQRQFGGVGAMVDRPGLEISARRSSSFEVHGPLAERARRFAQRVARRLGMGDEPPVRLEILRAPPQHVGLGAGTQLGMSVTAAMLAVGRRRIPPPAQLASLAGRGQRSAVGLYGFRYGGLLAEAGKLPGQDVSPLVARVVLPAAWRFVLLLPTAGEGLSGEAELSAFSQLPPISRETTNRLCRELVLNLLPAASAGDFDAFAASLFRYGHLAGTCFAHHQCGAFATAELARRVQCVRSLGVDGVGQSSWGPTLFAVFPTRLDAQRFARRFRQRSESEGVDLLIARPTSRGARLRTTDPTHAR